jgi:hypothetical protein
MEFKSSKEGVVYQKFERICNLLDRGVSSTECQNKSCIKTCVKCNIESLKRLLKDPMSDFYVEDNYPLRVSKKHNLKDLIELIQERLDIGYVTDRMSNLDIEPEQESTPREVIRTDDLDYLFAGLSLGSTQIGLPLEVSETIYPPVLN